MAHPGSNRALVRNAADPKQVRFAEQVERRRKERVSAALANVMSTEEGRIVMAFLIRRAGVFRSVWSPSSEIHYNSGRQDFGHELMADLWDISEDLYQQMEREESAWMKQQDRTIDAAHTKRASTSDEGENNG